MIRKRIINSEDRIPEQNEINRIYENETSKNENETSKNEKEKNYTNLFDFFLDKKNKVLNSHKMLIIGENGVNAGGLTRSIFDKCNECKSFHSTEYPCPKDKEKWIFSKWKHNKDFKTQECLYNYWFAKEFILDTDIYGSLSIEHKESSREANKTTYSDYSKLQIYSKNKSINICMS